MPDGTALRRTAKAKASAKESQGADTAQDESLVAPLEECSVCLNGFERPTMTPCAHWFCRRVQSSSTMPLGCDALAGLTLVLCSVSFFSVPFKACIWMTRQRCELTLCIFCIPEGAFQAI